MDVNHAQNFVDAPLSVWSSGEIAQIFGEEVKTLQEPAAAYQRNIIALQNANEPDCENRINRSRVENVQPRVLPHNVALADVLTKYGSSMPVSDLFIDQASAFAPTSWKDWLLQAKKVLQVTAPNTKISAINRVDCLTALQAILGFTIQDLAAVLRITRPQLYKWLDASRDITVQEANRSRLEVVERIAQAWAARSSAALSLVSKERLNDGGNLFTMLCADVINEEAIVIIFDELLARLSGKPASRSRRVRDAGFTRRPSVRSQFFDE